MSHRPSFLVSVSEGLDGISRLCCEGGGCAEEANIHSHTKPIQIRVYRIETGENGILNTRDGSAQLRA